MSQGEGTGHYLRAEQHHGHQADKVEYREKLRLITESDILSSLYQFRKLTQTDLLLFQEGTKQILKIIAPGFEVCFSDVTLTATSKVFIDLYHHFGFTARCDQLYNDLMHNTKQQIFLTLIQHLVELTKIAMQTAIKRFLDMRLFCIGKEIEKGPTQAISRRQLDYQSDNYSPLRKIKFKNVQRSESNQLSQMSRKQEALKLIIDYKDFHIRHHQRLSEVPPLTEKHPDSPTKSTRIIEEASKDMPQTQRDSQKSKILRMNDTTQHKLPSIHNPRQFSVNLFNQLKLRNQFINATIQNYCKTFQEKQQQSQQILQQQQLAETMDLQPIQLRQQSPQKQAYASQQAKQHHVKQQRSMVLESEAVNGYQPWPEEQKEQQTYLSGAQSSIMDQQGQKSKEPPIIKPLKLDLLNPQLTHSLEFSSNLLQQQGQIYQQDQQLLKEAKLTLPRPDAQSPLKPPQIKQFFE